MNIKERLSGLSQPAINQESKLFYHIGNAAITFSLLILLSWVSVTFGQQFHFSFSWILVIALLVTYFSVSTTLTIATAVVLIVLTLIALLVGYPSPSAFSVILFLVCLIGGYFVQLLAHKKQDTSPTIHEQLIGLLYSPLAYTHYVLELTKLDHLLGGGKGNKNNSDSSEH